MRRSYRPRSAFHTCLDPLDEDLVVIRLAPSGISSAEKQNHRPEDSKLRKGLGKYFARISYGFRVTGYGLRVFSGERFIPLRSSLPLPLPLPLPQASSSKPQEMITNLCAKFNKIV